MPEAGKKTLSIRERLCLIHGDIHGGDFDPMNITELELIVDILECITDELNKIDTHRHSVI